MKSFVTLFIFSLALNSLLAQEYTTDDQYKQALANAKQAFEAKQYSQAVFFYREAQKIKPESLLPKYKIEDIRTIYIEKEIKNQPQPSKNSVQGTKPKKNKKPTTKENTEDLIKERATKKMNEEADKVAQEMNQMKIENIQIIEDPLFIDTSAILIQTIEGNRETTVLPVEKKQITQLQNIQPENEEKQTTLVKREIPERVKTDSVVTESKIPETVVNKPTRKPEYRTQTEKKAPLTEEEKKLWIEHEQQRLATIYPNKKTIEEIEEPGKHITRVIMNINQKVVIYLKVYHSWGATFFFIDEVGQELKSINEQYFNLMTNLETYGN